MQVVSSSAPDSIDPAISYSNQGWSIIVMTNDGLVAFAKVGGPAGEQIVPDLSTNVPTPTDGGKVYTFHLRPGIKFSNGQTVVASDFRTSIERLFKSSSPSPYFTQIEGVSACVSKPKSCNLSKGIVTDNATGTITIHLTTPEPEFLQQLSLPFAFVLPPGLPDKDVGTHPVPATGPYMIRSYSPSTGLVLVRNPEFKQWSALAQPKGFPNQINWQLNVSPNQEVTQIENGQADWSPDQPPAGRLSEIGSQYPHQVHIEPVPTLYYLFLNTLIPPFNNLDAREAVNYAVDRAAVVRLFGGTAVASPTCQVLPPLIPGYKAYCPYTGGSTSSGQWTSPDFSKAQQLIAKSGTKGMKVSLYTRNDDPAESVGVYAQSLLTKLGYKVTLKSLAPAVYGNIAWNSATKANAGYFVWFPDYPSPGSAFIYPQFSCALRRLNSTANLNPSFFCDPSIDAKMNQAFATAIAHGSAAANSEWTAVDHAIVNKAPLAGLVNGRSVEFVSKRVGNFMFNPTFYTLVGQMWIK
jgi:peptide/nickel transport system substrate-binding protein